MDALAARSTLVTFDHRGTGASTRDVDFSFDNDLRDIEAVAQAADLGACTLLAEGTAVTPAARFAIEHPRKVDRLIMWPPLIAPFLNPDETFAQNSEHWLRDWSYGRRLLASLNYPDGPVALQRAFSANLKESVSAEMAVRLNQVIVNAGIDMLREISHPTLVLQRQARDNFRQDALQVASLVPNSELILVTGSAVTLFPEHQQIVEAIFEFMGLGRENRPSGAGTAIILFTDVVDSTAITARIGNEAFRDRTRQLDDALRTVIRDAGGSPVEGRTLGDGVLGVFTSAAQAIAAALQCEQHAERVGLQLHLGIHAGDVIREAGGGVSGIAVSMASRISDLTEPNEIFVSSTVRDLARASTGVTFEDRGEHALKGIAEPQRVFAVRRQE
jgi:class 3 adenylate cyclase